jgi:hypothetical protein
LFLLIARRQGFAFLCTFQCRLELIEVVLNALAEQRQGTTAGLTDVNQKLN